MKRVGVVGLCLMAVFAFSSIAVTNALASEWRVSSNAKAGIFSAASLAIRFLDGETEFDCNESTASGTLKEGTKVLGTEIGEINATTWNKGAETCTGPLSIKFKVTQLGKWKIEAESLLSGSIVHGKISNITADFSSSLCSFVVTGSLPAEYSNPAQTLAMGKALGTGLTVSGVNGCLGLIKNGDKPFIDIVYAMAAGSNVLILD